MQERQQIILNYRKIVNDYEKTHNVQKTYEQRKIWAIERERLNGKFTKTNKKK